jgi:hypothetical protein
LQHDFCSLWNHLISMTGDSENRRKQEIAICILRHIRKIYIALHQGTDAAPTAFNDSTEDYDNFLFYPSSYPLCNIPEHGQATAGPALHSSHSTTPLAYGMSLSDVPDTPHPITQVAVPSRRTWERPGSHQELATSRDVATRGARQGATDLPATLPMANSRPLSTLTASTSIPLQVSSDTVALVVPDMSSSFPPATHTPLAELDPFSAPPQSQVDQTPSAPANSLSSSQANLNMADTDVPAPVEAFHDPHQTARSGPDITLDVPLPAAPSHRGVDRLQ